MVKRSVVDVLQRGFENTIANWQLIALRLIGKVVVGAISVAALLAIIVPIFVSIGLHMPAINVPEDVLDVLTTLIHGWALLLWIALAVSVLLLVLVAVHSFIEAGCARVAVDGDRAAERAGAGPAGRFRVFSMSLWLAGAVEGWKTLFWIYNLAWGYSVLFLFIPLLPTLAAILLFSGNDTAVLGIGITGLVFTLLFFVVIAIVTSLWTSRAIVGWTMRHESARAALRTAWGAIKRDRARHALVALVVFVVSGTGSSILSGVGGFSLIGHSLNQTALVAFITMPLQLAGWLVSAAFSAVMAGWFLASYAALAVEE
jgi:hypothetical protein